MEQLNMQLNPFRIVKNYPARSFRYDETSEKFIETIHAKGMKNDVLRIILAMIFIHILSGNILGMGIQIVVYSLVYIFDRVYFEIILTDSRLLINSRTREKNKLLLAQFLLLALLIDNLYPIYQRPLEYTRIMYIFFIPENIAGVMNSIYLLFLSQLGDQIYIINNIGTSVFTLWFIIKMMREKNAYMNINKEGVSDAVFEAKKKFSTRGSIIAFFAILTLFIILTVLSIFLNVLIRGLLFLTSLLLVVNLKKEGYIDVSLYGRGGERITYPFFIGKHEFNRLHKIVGEIFGTRISVVPRRTGLQSLVPPELVSGYHVGQKSIFKNGALIGLYVGAVAYGTLLLKLFIDLYTKRPDLFNEITIVAIFTLFWFGLIWLGILNFIKISSNRLQRDKFIVGENFIAYLRNDNLWLLKNSLISGVRLKREGVRRFIQPLKYSKIEGLKMRWMTLITSFFLMLSALVIIQWIRFGAVNLEGIILILGYYLKTALNRVDVFVGTEGGLTILFGAILWVVIVLLVPRLLLLTRRKLIIEINKNSTLEFTVEKNIQITQIYQEMENNILDNSEKSPFVYKQRPGTVFCEVIFELSEAPQAQTRVILGSSRVQKRIRKNYSSYILKEPGQKGFIEFPITIKQGNLEKEVISKLDKNTEFRRSMTISGVEWNIHSRMVSFRN